MTAWSLSCHPMVLCIGCYAPVSLMNDSFTKHQLCPVELVLYAGCYCKLLPCGIHASITPQRQHALGIRAIGVCGRMSKARVNVSSTLEMQTSYISCCGAGFGYHVLVPRCLKLCSAASKCQLHNVHSSKDVSGLRAHVTPLGTAR